MPKVIVTGFGVFSGVDRNPTEDIINALNDWNPSFCSLKTAVLVCSVEYVQSFLSAQESEMSEECAPDSEIILVHLGVDAGSDTIKLESTAYNNMTFRVPDQSGYQPDLISIRPEQPFDAPHTTSLNIPKLCERLASEEWVVEPSSDPGRYLCNYVYYNSLCLSQKQLEKGNKGGEGKKGEDGEKKGEGEDGEKREGGGEEKKCQSIFIHVPAVDKLALADQIVFVKRAIEAMASHLE